MITKESAFIVECDVCGDSRLGDAISGDIATMQEAKALARRWGFRNDLKYGNGLCCRECYRRRASL